MLDGMLVGVERRRRWTDEVKLAILSEAGVNGWTVADVAQRHDVARQQIYQWRREMRRKGLWPSAEAPVFLPVEMASAPEGVAAPEPDGTAAEITVMLRNGRRLRCPEGIGEAALAQNQLRQKPAGGAVFAFRGRKGDRLKLLYWDGQGFCLYYKVLERGRFAWPSAVDGAVRLTSAQLAMLWEGIDWRRPDWGAPPSRVG